MKKVLLLVGAWLVVVTGPAILAQGEGVIIERVIVRVNGEIFTQSELTQRQIDELRDQLRDQGKAAATVTQADLDKVTPDLLVGAVDDLLLVQRAREMGVKFDDSQFKQYVEKLKKDNKLDDEGFKKALMAEENMTVEQLRQRFERAYMINSVQQHEIGPSMMITQEEKRQYYEKHKEQFMSPAMVTLRELFVAIPSVMINGKEMINPASEDASRKKIEDLRDRAIKGEDFAKLATENSEAASKAAGGLLPAYNLDDLAPALKDAIGTLQAGGITAPVRGPKGFQVFKIEARAVPQVRPFATVSSQAEAAIKAERLEPQTKKLLTRLRAQAVIEWKDDRYRDIYQKRMAEN
jgi:parvulin-like peptidyl-prolyl isomerase